MYERGQIVPARTNPKLKEEIASWKMPFKSSKKQNGKAAGTISMSDFSISGFG
jgi:hypothetical protein